MREPGHHPKDGRNQWNLWSSRANDNCPLWSAASLEDAIRVNVTNQTANSAVIQWKPPRPLSDCPGLLKKYIICCQKEQYGNITGEFGGLTFVSWVIQFGRES